MTTTTYGMPFFLEDKTGDLGGSEFSDLYNRMRFSLRCTRRDAHHTAFMVFDISSNACHGGLMAPVACFDYGANNALGTVKIGDGQHVEIAQYLSKLSRSSRTWKFVAADGHEYRWTHQTSDDCQWMCVNSAGNHVATYSLKPAGEPQYTHSSGCTLTVEEAYPQLVGELLATLSILRHIIKHNL